MSCDYIRQALLDFGWDQAGRNRAAQVVQHLAECEACRTAAENYDWLREALSDDRSKSALPPGGWDSFADRLLSAAAGSSRRSWLSLGLGLAASLLIVGTSGFEIGRLTGPRTGVGPVPPVVVEGQAPEVHLTSQDIRRQVQAFGQMSTVFERRASWLLLCNGASDIGLMDGPVMGEKQLLLLRLAMSRNGAAVSIADLAIVPGQRAKLTIPLEHGRKLRYELGTSSGQPTRLTIWAEVQLPQGGQTVAALATDLHLEPNQRIRAGQLTTSAGAYELDIAFAQAASPSVGP